MKDEKRYTLRNKNHAVLDFLYDLDTHRVTNVLALHDVRYAPPAILDFKGNVTRSALNGWWMSRAIPASRAQIRRLMDELNINSTLALAEKNFGLSLSDRYWIDDPDNPQDWDTINFFDNDFTEDLGLLTLGQDSSSDNPNLMSPNSTVGGDLNKKWTIVNGTRVLIKGGTGLTNQEVFNEVIATHLHRRLLERGDFVPYSLHQEGNRIYCACPNMLGEDEELVPALHIVQNRRRPNTQNDYQFLVSCFESLGLKDVETFLSKMFTCDFLIANFDRHYRNFGVIRNVETLEYTRFAPIFDTGNSLWCNVYSLDTYRDFDYIAKPFGRGLSPMRQLNLLSHFEWFNPKKLSGFAEEAANLLSTNRNLPQDRIERIRTGIEHQMENAISYIEKQPSFQVSRNDRSFLRSESKDMKAAMDELSNAGTKETHTHSRPR